jgi:hypothetical protein
MISSGKDYTLLFKDVARMERFEQKNPDRIVGRAITVQTLGQNLSIIFFSGFIVWPGSSSHPWQIFRFYEVGSDIPREK